jgi:replicative DNA helicase
MKITTGFKSFDKRFGCLKSKEVTLIAGRPGMGKTIFLINLGANASINNRVLFWSLENSKEYLGKKFNSPKMQINDNIELSKEELIKTILDNHIELLLIDYLQLLKISMTELKKIAIDCNLCIMLTSQLSRDLEYRDIKDRKPKLLDLQITLNNNHVMTDFDNILYLYQESYYNVDCNEKCIELFSNTKSSKFLFGKNYGVLIN